MARALNPAQARSPGRRRLLATFQEVLNRNAFYGTGKP